MKDSLADGQSLEHALKRHAPAAERNRQPILEVLRLVLPPAGAVLELSSGTGQHAHFFAEQLPDIDWRPSDIDADALASIGAYQREGPANLAAPVALDVCAEDWGAAADGIVAALCINLIHISPWICCQGLILGAERHLPSGGLLITYGPYRFDGTFTAASNERFDLSLRSDDSSWGVRDVTDVTALARRHQLEREAIHEMPANNHVLVFRRQ